MDMDDDIVFFFYIGKSYFSSEYVSKHRIMLHLWHTELKYMGDLKQLTQKNKFILKYCICATFLNEISCSTLPNNKCHCLPKEICY